MSDKLITVKDGDQVEWLGTSLPRGMYADRGIVLEMGEPYTVGEPTFEGGSVLDADFAAALVNDGHAAVVKPRPAKSTPPAKVGDALETTK